MQTIQDAFKAPDLPKNPVVTIGNYDGVHVGQQAVLQHVVERAKELDTCSAVVTFDPHPLEVVRPDMAPIPLTTAAQKQKLIEQQGIDFLLILRFDAELSRQSAESFAEEFLVGKLGVREVWVGSDFSFGRDREGNLERLRSIGEKHGFKADSVDEVRSKGARVSSTMIRGLVEGGAVDRAAELLGRPYALTGTVVRGDRMGQRLGWPTINLDAENELIPAEGVYATRVEFPSFPTAFDGVTNIGTRPTVYENYQQVVETHILEFRSDVYGEEVQVSFYRRLRDEKLFRSMMDLSAQIAKDVETARDYFRGLAAESGPVLSKGILPPEPWG